jgi:hypothetical protein
MRTRQIVTATAKDMKMRARQQLMQSLSDRGRADRSASPQISKVGTSIDVSRADKSSRL